ncbi:MAG TPA: vWA domain-containing protein [Spirochaetota bacterium]|nr:vWA domain-containing protein [Spirochaetota bacterium]HOL56286.1 vWA domain-containing protein [Spirochaetota bacterium]HPP03676.1 vWA domain-containing protein [Spirochaetota bacterium]
MNSLNSKIKFFIILLCSLSTVFIYTQNLIFDDVTIDRNNALITFHNYPDDITNNIRLTIDNKEESNFNLTLLNIKNLYYIIIDNSGSILEEDIEIIKEKLKFFLSNLKKDDLVNLDKVNDEKINIYKLAPVTEKLYESINLLKREGNYSRLYDAVLSSYKELLDLKKSNEYKDYNYYLIFFSDGEDINSENKGSKVLELDGIPFFFFCYGDSYNPALPKPFIELTEKTEGKFLESPDNNNIKKIFFDNENRYLLKFPIDINKIIKSRQYIVRIARKDNPENRIEIDLKKLFPDIKIESKDNNLVKNTFINKDHKNKLIFNINLIPILIGILILILLLILFFILRKIVSKISFSQKKYSNKKEDSFVTNSSTLNILSNNEVKSENSKTSLQEQSKIKEINNQKNYINQKEKYNQTTKDFLLNELTKEDKILIEYKTLCDNSPKRIYNRFDIFHSQHTSYIDKPDKNGEEIEIDSLFKILSVEKDFLEVESEKLFLIDEDIVITHLLLKVQKIEYNIKKENFKIRLFSLEDKDLTNFFKVSKEIIGTKKRKIFGSKDAIIESFIKKDKDIPIIRNIWFKGELKKENNSLILITEEPVFLDIKLSIKYNEIINEYDVKKIEKKEDKFYIYLS